MRISDDQLEYIDEGVLRAERLLTRLREIIGEAEQLIPLTAERLAVLNDDDRRTFDVYLKRFQDAYEAGKGLFRSGLLLAGLGWPKLSYLSLVNEAERYEVLPSAAAWLDVMDARNSAAHEYAMNEARQAALLTEAVAQGGVLLDQLGAALEFVRSRRSLSPRGE